MKDNYRPAAHQVTIHYRCSSCGHETQMESCYGVENCHCGGQMVECGESYPADPSEWDEQHDPDGEWRERRW